MCALACWLFSATAGADLDGAVRAYQAGDYRAAVPLIEQHADAGNPEAQMFLGFIYQQGKGVPRDLLQARRWYKRAARGGDPTAQMELGLMYEIGQGVEADGSEAEFWYGQAVARDFCPGELPAGGRLSR